MSGAAILRAARAAGLDLRIDGDSLVLQAHAPPPPEILDALTSKKQEIIDLLRPGRDGWSAEYWQAFFDERAGIAAADDGLPRDQAEARAFACCVGEWLNRNPVCSPPGRCLDCGEAEQGQNPLLPFGIETTGHAWLHSRCWTAWHAGRKAEAVVALKVLGVEPPPDFPNDFGKSRGA